MAHQSESEDRSEEGSFRLPDCNGGIDVATFEQILEMDDDEEERDFSKNIVFDFFNQADETFVKMDKCLEERDLAQLSALGHFLKGSSATLGLVKVKDSCEKIQHYGSRKDESGTVIEPDDNKSLSRIQYTLKQVKVDYAEVEKALRKWYDDL